LNKKSKQIHFLKTAQNIIDSQKVFVLTIFMFISVKIIAQDPLYSQYYAAPMYLNPALTGSSNIPRFTLNYRNQWPALSANFVTTSFAAEHYIEKYNSGVGLLITSDNQYADLTTSNFGLLYSYNQAITEDISVRFGVQGSYNTRTIGSKWDRFTFGDQLDGAGNPTGNPTNDPIADKNNPRVNFMDFSTGTVVYNDNFYLGLGVKHLNKPIYNLIKDATEQVRLPMLFSVHGGYKFFLENGVIDGGFGEDLENEKSISPSFLYEKRGPYQHLDVGMYLTYAPMILGVWYRGLPIFGQDISGATRNVAGVFMLGYKQDNLTFGYSYDANFLSRLTNTGGAHEISISYELAFDKSSRSYKKKKAKPIPCPKL
jgi:type IX secretion system PorP/SprF family membrane protein